MAAKKHTFDVKELSSAIDNIIVQGSKVSIIFQEMKKPTSSLGNLQTAN